MKKLFDLLVHNCKAHGGDDQQHDGSPVIAT
jgi:hypothetical protein